MFESKKEKKCCLAGSGLRKKYARDAHCFHLSLVEFVCVKGRWLMLLVCLQATEMLVFFFAELTPSCCAAITAAPSSEQ